MQVQVKDIKEEKEKVKYSRKSKNFTCVYK